ncbi:MAG: acyl-CoA synthetase [Hyphomicrobiales bacterium]
MRSRGIKAGDHIAILMENRREFLETCFSADRTGVYYTTISTHLSEPEIAFILQDCDARLLILSDRFAALAGSLARVSDCDVLVVGSHVEASADWPGLLETMPKTPIADEAQGLDMLYSSGTTGRPKGIKWPLPNDRPGGPAMLIDLLTGLFGYGADSRYLCPAPLYHAAPLRHSMVTIKMGGTAYIMEKFDAAEALRLIELHQITHSQWVPTMFVRLLKLSQTERAQCNLSSMQMAVHAAAPCPPEIKRQMIDWWGEIIHEYYAGTENTGFTAITSAEWLSHPGSVGRAKLGTLHICDEDGAELPAGATGEVYFENGHQFTYHKDPAKTAACTNSAGWTTLGDIGHVDDAGYLYLTDRKSFVIISGGVNIYPQETEDVLLSHPAVLDSAVIGVPHEEFGEEVKAIVQLGASETKSDALEQSLITYCRARLSPIKCPRSIDFHDTLPRSATGKLYKRKLRDLYWNS